MKKGWKHDKGKKFHATEFAAIFSICSIPYISLSAPRGQGTSLLPQQVPAV